MNGMIKRLSRVADCGEPANGVRKRHHRRALAGHMPVRVGEEGERSLVWAELLGRPAFTELLRRSAQEYGYGQSGPLCIPCLVPLFRRLLLAGAAVMEEELASTEPVPAPLEP